MAAEGVTHRTIEVNGINMHVAEKGEGPVVLFIHGFPELWYTWRHQIHALAAHGYRPVAPDLRGFGDTDAPPSAADYSIFSIVGDLIALIASLGEDKLPSGNWEMTAPWTGEKILVPTKFIIGDLGQAHHRPGMQNFIHSGGFKKFVPLLEEVVIMEGVGHFINEEKPEEISNHIVDFFRKF